MTRSSLPFSSRLLVLSSFSDHEGYAKIHALDTRGRTASKQVKREMSEGRRGEMIKVEIMLAVIWMSFTACVRAWVHKYSIDVRVSEVKELIRRVLGCFLNLLWPLVHSSFSPSSSHSSPTFVYIRFLIKDRKT